MSYNEYMNFYNNILLPIQLNLKNTANNFPVASSYEKSGETWQFVYQLIEYNTFTYCIIATVSNNDIYESSNSINNSINKSVTSLIIAVVFSIVFVMLLLLYFINILIKTIINPINQLKELCISIINDDLTGNNITFHNNSDISSLDMKILLQTFHNLIIALRFGSESYSHGNIQKALQVFTDGLNLFNSLNNIKGIAICENNLASVEMSMNNYVLSEQLYLSSIKRMEEIIEHSPDDITPTGSFPR